VARRLVLGRVFLPYFAAQGFVAQAFSFRSHGRRPAVGALRSQRGADYVADLAQMVGQIGQAPVLVGHSLGGYVVQKYLEQAWWANELRGLTHQDTGGARAPFTVGMYSPRSRSRAAAGAMSTQSCSAQFIEGLPDHVGQTFFLSARGTFL
jgi:pimeloyl-ACP methyl ester carboxylesterase